MSYMKEFEAVPIQKIHPSMADNLRSLKIGESAKIRLIGRVYNNYQSARSKLQKAGVGRWEHEFSKNGEELIITRKK